MHTDVSITKSEGDSAGLGGLVQVRDGGEEIPPVVARIFSGDSTSPLTREASVIVLWRKWLYFKTMRMQGRLTLHVRRLVHISQVSGVFLKG